MSTLQIRAFYLVAAAAILGIIGFVSGHEWLVAVAGIAAVVGLILQTLRLDDALWWQPRDKRESTAAASRGGKDQPVTGIR